MEIVFDHQAFSLQVTGGITRYYYEVIRRLNRIDDISTHTQLGFCTTIWPLQDATSSRSSVLHWGKRPFNSGVGTFLLNEALLNPYNLCKKKKDIYHNTLYRFMPGIRARSYVATHHDCTIERYPQLFREASMVIKAKKKMLRQADLVFCITESCRNDLHEFYDFDRSRSLVLTNGSDPLPRSEAAKAELAGLVQRPYLLYVGTRFSYKNFSGFLRAFAQSGLQKDYALLAIGGGSFSDAELQEVKSLGLEQALLTRPLASPEFLGEAYAGASLFVYPSFYEGLGLPPLEAMEKGCPVLASSNPASVEVCKDAALFFDPQDEGDFERQLRAGLEQSAQQRARIARGYEVCKLYTWEQVVPRMIEAYRSLL